MSFFHLARTQRCNTKTLYPYEEFAVERFNKIKGDLTILNFKSTKLNTLNKINKIKVTGRCSIVV